MNPDVMDVLVDVVAEIRRVEAITNRALTADEVTTLKAGAFFRRIRPDLFEDKPGKDPDDRRPGE